ncbi:MAG: hypothetical protein ACRDS9_04020 [Pseudonocardiaceae bacterium]
MRHVAAGQPVDLAGRGDLAISEVAGRRSAQRIRACCGRGDAVRGHSPLCHAAVREG